jgi:hypothetical protein
MNNVLLWKQWRVLLLLLLIRGIETALLLPLETDGKVDYHPKCRNDVRQNSNQTGVILVKRRVRMRICPIDESITSVWKCSQQQIPTRHSIHMNIVVRFDPYWLIDILVIIDFTKRISNHCRPRSSVRATTFILR